MKDTFKKLQLKSLKEFCWPYWEWCTRLHIPFYKVSSSNWSFIRVWHTTLRYSINYICCTEGKYIWALFPQFIGEHTKAVLCYPIVRINEHIVVALSYTHTMVTSSAQTGIGLREYMYIREFICNTRDYFKTIVFWAVVYADDFVFVLCYILSLATADAPFDERLNVIDRNNDG